MKLFSLLMATCAAAGTVHTFNRGPGEICGPYPGAFCDEGLTCVTCKKIPGAPGVVSNGPCDRDVLQISS
jgi:hypothetical protein